jgi:hypothetical protein
VNTGTRAVGPPRKDFSRGGEKEMVRHYLKIFSDDCQEARVTMRKAAAGLKWRAKIEQLNVKLRFL